MLLSVIVPVYNARLWLGECLDSLLGQTDPDFELLVVDDGSTDGSGAICDEYAARDARVRVIHQPNAGLCGARNAALPFARGAYVTFADADDVAHPELVRCVRAAIKETSADLLWWGWKEFSEKPDLTPVAGVEPQVIPAGELIWEIIGEHGKCRGYAWNKAFRREIVRDIRFDKTAGHWEDVFFSATVLVAGGMRAKCAALNRELYAYRQHADSLSKTFSNKTLHKLFAADRINEMLAPLPLDSARKIGYVNELLRGICIMNKKLMHHRVENQRQERLRLDALWRKYERSYRRDGDWTLKVRIYRRIQNLCAFCRSGRMRG